MLRTAQAAVAAALVLVLWRARLALLPFAFAALIAYLLAPLVAVLERRGLAPWLCVSLVYAALALVTAAVVVEVVPSLGREGHDLLRHYPAYVRAAERGLAAVERTYRGLALPPPVRAESDRAVARAGAALTGAVRGTLKNLEQGLPVLGAVVLSPFLAYYLLRDRRRLAAAFWHRVPDEARPRVARTLADLDAAVGGFLRGQILVAVLVGVMALGVSLAFRLPYPLFIALVAATTDLIPYVGPLLGAVPAVAVALLRSPLAALWVLGAFLAIHQFEGLVLSPNLVGARVGLHPLVVFGALLVGGELFGVAGVLVGVPVLAAVRILVRFGLGELRRWAGRPRRLSPLPRLR